MIILQHNDSKFVFNLMDHNSLTCLRQSWKEWQLAANSGWVNELVIGYVVNFYCRLETINLTSVSVMLLTIVINHFFDFKKIPKMPSKAAPPTSLDLNWI